MGEPARTPSLSVEGYLASEKEWPIRREYVAGQVYAMSGGSSNHNRVAVNLSTQLFNSLASSDCEVFINDLKVRVSATVFYYPDIVVTCENLPGKAYFCEQPRLIVEILSPSTERTDRNEKMREYQQMASLHEYVLIAQDQIRVEVYRHENAGEPWQKEIYTELAQEAFFESIDLKVKLAEIYRRVHFSDVSEGEEEER